MRLLCFSVLLLSLAGGGLAAGEEACRIVSLSPALTETLWHLGGGSLQVGRSSACNRPGNVRSLPAAGNFGEPDMERVAALRPTLVLADAMHYRQLIPQFAALGIRFELLRLESIADYRSAVLKIGELAGLRAAARREAGRIDRALAEARRRAAKRHDKVRVLYLVWHSPLMTVGQKSFVHQFIELAGGVNVAGGEKRSYFTIANEFVLKAKPGVVIFPRGSGAGAQAAEALTKLPGWATLPAVRNRQIHTELDGDLFLRLGPRFDRALAGLEQCFYPGEKKPCN